MENNQKSLHPSALDESSLRIGMVSSIHSYCFCLFQAKDTISRYDEARSGLAVAEQDAAEIEKRSNEAGEALVRAGSEITSLHSQIAQLETKRKQQEQLVKNINKVHKGSCMRIYYKKCQPKICSKEFMTFRFCW